MSARTVAAWAAMAVIGAAGAAGCSTVADELESDLAAMTSERDALASQVEQLQAEHAAAAARYDAADATRAGFESTLDDDSRYADPEAMIEDLSTYWTATAILDDIYIGPQPIADGLMYDLFETGGSQLDLRQSWIDPDGSTSGAVWLWHGRNIFDNPFELVMVTVTTYDDEGLITDFYRSYPYDQDFFHEALRGEGTPTDATGTAW
ncbi:hypothetical protein QQX10_04620 [Demequina sp. SYSU T00039]|uniref:Nuclear transport factor 2 family protein n=1 Tax=Demequina lignilytica TaxID=3051663 RepID=A0AAW7M8K3_9MICO|nr:MULTISPECIES: hypothetical protein [unclassified Demequina]MDN4477278.1 hypothetical protein [Demequina sp. SYSU T00039-1]MDN4487451.1 hypothetical protein [Demequina sp. SYSU T00039]